MGMSDGVEVARAAVERRDWLAAYTAYSTVGPATLVEPDDVAALGDAAWWCGHLGEAIALRERAFGDYLAAGAPVRAANVALSLAFDHIQKVSVELAFGWFTRAQELLADQPPSAVHGRFAVYASHLALAQGDPTAALAAAEGAAELGRQTGDRDVQAEALTAHGRALIGLSRVQDGLGMLGMAGVAAISGQLQPLTTNSVYCLSVMAENDLGEYRRAGELSDAATRWCDRQSLASGFPGTCRIHRAEVLRLRGDWPEAEREARRGVAELRDFNAGVAAEGWYQIGEILQQRGDADAAEEAFGTAHELGRDPQPGLARLLAARGQVGEALAELQGLLHDPMTLPMQPMIGSPSHPLRRAKILYPLVDIALAAGDVEAARVAASELADIAAAWDTAAMRAMRAYSRAMTQTGTVPADQTRNDLREAVREWIDADSPYEAARARVALATIQRGMGQNEAAAVELRSARSVFERLGAEPDLIVVDRMLADRDRSGASTRVTRTFMVTDIVGSTGLLEAIGDDAWDDLLRWHRQAVRMLLARHQGEEIDHAGDGFFLAFASPDRAIACAIDLQRDLAEHRLRTGFAPRVRVGIHQADAVRVDKGYAGRGVHEAARIGGHASGDEILVSVETIQASGREFAQADVETVALKGLAQPVEVVRVRWSG